jgi:hypothetical protein
MHCSNHHHRHHDARDRRRFVITSSPTDLTAHDWRAAQSSRRSTHATRLSRAVAPLDASSHAAARRVMSHAKESVYVYVYHVHYE